MLRDYLAGDAADGLLFVTSQTGRRMTERWFSSEFRLWLRGLGPEFAELHFHGLRTSTATALAESGASGKEMQAILGWRTEAMSAVYTKGTDQRKLATAAVKKLDRAAAKGTKHKP